MTRPAPPPPAPPPRTNYLGYGLVGVLVGAAIVVVVLLMSGYEEPAATSIAAGTTSTTAAAAVTTAPETDPATTTAPSTTTSPTTSAPSFDGGTDPRTADGPAFGTFAFLDDIRFAPRQGFTRVVFDFEGTEVPWWSVAYVSGPFTNIGDEPVPVDGTAFIEVDLASTSFDLSGAEVRLTYTGPDRISIDTASVTEVVVLEDFEGVSTWIIGVREQKPFAVGTLTDPPRVYIDIQD